MKNVLLGIATCCFFLLGTTSYGQVNILAGLGLSYGFEAEAVGLNIRGEVDFNESWGGSFNFITYFSPGFGGESADGIDAVYREINFDAHYFFLQEPVVYALGGLNLTTAGFKSDIPFIGNFGATETKVGLNLGGGARFPVAEQISIMGELKYIISDFDQLTISASGLYHF